MTTAAHELDAADLLARASERAPLTSEDGKSAVPMERIVVDGTAYVVKHISTRFDWISRATGDWGCRAFVCWDTGILERLPPEIDHTTVAAMYDADTVTATLVMNDVSEHLVPPGSAKVSLGQHAGFIEHMARLHATFWDVAADLPVLTPLTTRYAALTPLTAELEMARADCAETAPAIDAGWRALDDVVPDAARMARALVNDPWPLVAALNETPQTLVHGDWKMGNLGTHPDGRTVLIDWQWPGTAPPCVDLAWYLAINCDRIPESKNDTITRYRAALERNGISTDSWFDEQLSLCLLGGFLQMGWNKTHDQDELDWWVTRAMRTAATL